MSAPFPPPGTGVPSPHTSFSAGPRGLVVAAPAKLNLYLEVLGKRPDGFHELETLMVGLNLYDTLEVRPRADGEFHLTCDDPTLSTGPDNLVVKAATHLRLRAGNPSLGTDLHLTKRIPTQAGLAGGSSDAAAALLALNRVWGLNLSRAALALVAADVGSDVAFFLSLPAGWCTGRGEHVAPEPPGTGFPVVLVLPPVGLSTPAVFRQLHVPASPRSGDPVRAAFRAGDATALGAALFNRLEEPAFALAPEVERVYRRLAALNPVGCLMSGSGSAVFAVCRDPHDAARVAAGVRAAAPPDEPPSHVLVARTLTPDPA
ncbi:4-(cytidine 5'-diphospho)-2-C-methyl-D-erythritol kinase [Urbifossiella limnaea]|uniref:4-diphosphocytidyl-2-C-methyl-D-erythritol kinase n=1 Tax=Urbifossiella limnaea TaxID=2528023 RepID=A0A517XPL9_9BACT|nr:4-(cytidine 5'-diphospho)-2-C-methyl-D-erythritol kinase [Urbifossiella limnaea]QDU19453.1 4-diphosphocytidyl-2-C-methyl-D-erythritol kinase [Urbifossiella limnaea]